MTRSLAHEGVKVSLASRQVELRVRQSIIHIALVVRDYDEAIVFYTQKLRFTLIADTEQPEQDKRWVVIAPPGGGGTTGQPDMPASAIASGCIDYVLSPEAIATTIIRIAHGER